jgi:hypothetical protein
MPIRWHEEDPALFHEAIRFTAAETGFIPRLIEKDYFCSVLLEYLAAGSEALIFKGGTCLAKVHRQLETQLRPVLRAQEYGQFELDRAMEIVREVARAVG